MSLLFNVLEQPCRRFSMSELSLATENFDERWCIGQGGFGRVYKGKISEGPNNTYAIKRLHFTSDQGEPEFWVEVEMLSRLRHCNIVPLIGYCNKGKEMALVYEYMHNGTLYDHLHKKGTVLTWSQRLKICIGAARGLDYLHTGTGTQQGVIHRDVKSSNILLDQNYAAKIADFGLAKIGPTNQTQTHVSTTIKGTFGYMDPNYFYTGRLRRKSDVYSFGVVLLEVLCGKPALDKSLDEGLAIWAQDRIKQGKVNQIIDCRLRNHISKSSLKEFSRIAVRCLFTSRNLRPTMTEVVGSLERALSFQERKASSTQGGITIKNVWSLLSLKSHFGSTALGENVSMAVPPVISEVEVDQREPLEGQDGKKLKPSRVNPSNLTSIIATSPSTSALGPTETFSGLTEIKESLEISISFNAGVSSGVELKNGYMFDHVPAQEGENNGLSTRYPTSNNVNNAPALVEETYKPGVYITLLDFGDGTTNIKRVRFSRRKFDYHQGEIWWIENREKVREKYNVRLYAKDSESEWMVQYELGVYLKLSALPDGTNELKRVRFSRRRFGEQQSEAWWSGNRKNVYERYNVTIPVPLKNLV